MKVKKSVANKTLLSIDRRILPLFLHHHDQYLLFNYNNTQVTRNPGEIVYFMNKRDYFEKGRKISKLGYEYKLRLSNEPIGSTSAGRLQGVYWTMYGFDNLLTEPISKAILILKVLSCDVQENKMETLF